MHSMFTANAQWHIHNVPHSHTNSHFHTAGVPLSHGIGAPAAAAIDYSGRHGLNFYVLYARYIGLDDLD